MNRTLIGFIRKEMSQALRDPRMRGMLFVMPVVQLLVFGFALSSEIRNIRIAFSKNPDDVYSEQLAQRYEASGWFKKIDINSGDPFDWVRSGKAEAVLVAPAGGADKAAGRQKGMFQLLIDATNSERARGIEQYARAIFALHNKQYFTKNESSHGQNFQFSIRTLYNPQNETATYMIPGTLCLMLCLATVILTSMSMAKERESGTLETLLAAPISPWEVLAGKTIPYIILGMCDLPLVLAVAWVMGVPIRGPLWEIFVATLVFVCTTVSAGFLLSSYSKNQQQAMLAGFLFLFPSIQLSGVIYPIENMPAAIAALAYVNPLRYFVIIMRHLMLKGGDMGLLFPHLAVMAGLGIIAITLAGKRFHQTLN